MTSDLVLANLVSWSIQVLVLVAVCGAMPFVLRLRAPKPLLLYFQAVLLVCCALPFVQQWAQPVIQVQPPSRESAAKAAPLASPERLPGEAVDWTGAALWIVIAGAGGRLLMLTAGFARLHWLRRTAVPVVDAEALSVSMGVRASAGISASVTSPVTFGYWRPLILLPESFPLLAPESKEAVLCHELMHVARRDWIAVVLEEIAASVLWFHPAIWWLHGRIRLAREQAVDREVVRLLGARDKYVEALVAVANGGAAVDLTPAAPFLRRRTLILRVSALVQEAKMSRKQIAISLGACASAMLLAAWLVTTAFPLRAAPQVQPAPDQNVTAEPGSLTLLHRPPLRYPTELRAKGVKGSVTLELTVDANGSVTDARVLNGPEELRKTALQSVLEWHYSKPGAPARVQATLNYEPPPAPDPAAERARKQALIAQHETGLKLKPGVRIARISYSLPDAVKQEIEPLVRDLIGQEISPSALSETWARIAELEPHATMSFRGDVLEIALRDALRGVIGGIVGSSPMGAPPTPPPPPGQIRVGGNVQAAKLIREVRPEYPPLARQARIQGIVRFNVVIGTDGRVQHVQLVSGHPLMVPSATEAVRQYEYQTTLLNGVPVEIHTVVDVPFTLEQ